MVCCSGQRRFGNALADGGRLHRLVRGTAFLGNLIGWSVAVVVSFSGHYFLTFRHQTKSMRHAIRRFLILSAGGFAVNQFAFINLLATTGIPYYWLLAFILVAIAALTFVVSRYWAFRHSP
jgi:putative flippase GtrA